MQLTLTQQARLEQTLSPRMIQFFELLAAPLTDLEDEVSRQIAENPALELSEMTLPPERSRTRGTADLGDWVARLPAPSSLRAQLRGDFLLGERDPERIRIGLRLIDDINDDGYLDASIGEVAMLLGASVVLVEQVLESVWALDPPGVGARDLRECLRLQVERHARAGLCNTAARRLLDECWEPFSRHSLDLCARRLRLPPAVVEAGADWLRDNCHPYPGRSVQFGTAGDDLAPLARPEVAIVPNTAQRPRYLARVLRSERVQLQVDHTYRQLDDEIRAGAAVAEDEREHVLTLVGAARQFIASLNQRLETVRRVTQVVANAQAGFVALGPAHLVPLTRLEVARRLELHESTVGRAVAGKHAILPNGEVVALETFFDDSQPVRLALEQIIAAEDPRRPMSDDALAQRLAELGFDVARRTVAKYRGLLRIPAASARKRAS
ncbi:MAG: hypothetical protein HZB16_04365 [Armatimonadetes bacterium]|nr:hypothetical protein [Armatimonadota bacterium]